MDQDSPDNPKASGRQTARRGSDPVPPRTDLPQEAAAADIDPAMVTPEEDDEALLPEVSEELSEAIPEGPLAVGPAPIEQAGGLPPTPPGRYPMLNAANEAPQSGKATKL